MPQDEKVLVIPTAHFEVVGSFQGFRPADEAYRARLLDRRQYVFCPRAEVETDPRYKQLIPYLVLRWGEEVFHYRRGAAGGESRLHARRSIGIGGHIALGDAHLPDPYHAGMLRELTEEVHIQANYRERLLGFINDDRTPVGSVHLGVVHLLDLDRPEVTPREDALADAGFLPIHRLLEEREEFETWSQFALEAVASLGQ